MAPEKVTQSSDTADETNSSGSIEYKQTSWGPQSSSSSSSSVGMDVALLWASPEHGLLLQEYQNLEAAGAAGGFLGIAVPNLLVNKSSLVTRPGLPPFTTSITRVPLQVSTVAYEALHFTVSAGRIHTNRVY
jgi:hypothetical protein